jgi:hypothetical protein
MSKGDKVSRPGKWPLLSGTVRISEDIGIGLDRFPMSVGALDILVDFRSRSRPGGSAPTDKWFMSIQYVYPDAADSAVRGVSLTWSLADLACRVWVGF